MPCLTPQKAEMLILITDPQTSEEIYVPMI